MAPRPGTQPARKALAERSEEMRKQLNAAIVEAAEPASIATLDAALQAAERAEGRIVRPYRATILLGLSAGLMTASLIGAGLYFTMLEATFRLQAEAWAVTVTAAPTGAYGVRERPPLSSVAPFDISELRLLAGDEAAEERVPVGRIEELRVHNGTTFELLVDKEDCLLLRILGDSTVGHGAEITIGVTTEAQSSLPPEGPRQLQPGDTARFCGIEIGNPFMIGGVKAVRLTRVYREDAPRLEASTIVEGSLSIPEVGENRKLLSTDRLVLEDMRSTSLVVRLVDGKLSVTVDGRAADPRVFTGAPTLDSKALLPSLLTYATRSSPALLLGMAIGLFGTIWNGLKLLMAWRLR